MDAGPVIEHVEICSDATRIVTAIEERVQLVVARGVSVRVELARAGRGSEARARIVLPDGSEEERVFSSTTRACVPLAHALGAWVSVRMDEWSVRKASVAPAAEPAPAEPPPPTKSAVTASLPPSGGLDAAWDVDRDGKRIAEPEGPELSLSSSLLGNLGRYTLVGVSGAGTFAVTDRIMVRAIGFAYSGAVNKSAVLGARAEGCRRVPGRYTRTRGLALDLCAGAEMGILEGWSYGSVGPSVIIHGDLARALSLDLGGGVGLPFGKSVERPTPDGLVVAVRGDLGLSWRMP